MRELVRWSLVAGLITGFVLLLIAARGDSMLPGDLRFTRWIQGLDWPALNVMTDALNWMMKGTPLSISGLAIVVILVRQGLIADSILLLAAIAIRFINGFFKDWTESPRPTTDLVRVTEIVPGYGFPSGHAVGALLVVGTLAWILARHIGSRSAKAAIWALAILVIVLAGVGRIRVGAHWPTDVLGSWLWGSAALLVLASIVCRARVSTR